MAYSYKLREQSLKQLGFPSYTDYLAGKASSKGPTALARSAGGTERAKFITEAAACKPDERVPLAAFRFAQDEPRSPPALGGCLSGQGPSWLILGAGTGIRDRPARAAFDSRKTRPATPGSLAELDNLSRRGLDARG
jgi:hypothetical protein